MSLRLGLAGLGTHGRRYAEHLLRGDVPGARLAAISRSDEELGREFARDNGVVFVREPAELATHPEVDAVVLCLPPHLHPAAAEACLSHGRPVLVEKPLAPDAKSARRLADLAERTGSFLMVGQSLRWDGVVRALKREAAGIGPIRCITVNQRFEPSDRPWLDVPGTGGMFLNTGVHGFDLLRHLTGAEPTHAFADAERFVTRRTEDLFTAMFRLEPGPILATVDNTRSSRSRSGRIEIVGAQAQVWCDHIHRTLCRVRGREIEDLGPVPQENTLPLVLGSLVRSLREGQAPPVGAADGLAAAEMIEAALLSVRTGRRVSMDEVRGD